MADPKNKLMAGGAGTPNIDQTISAVDAIMRELGDNADDGTIVVVENDPPTYSTYVIGETASANSITAARNRAVQSISGSVTGGRVIQPSFKILGGIGVAGSTDDDDNAQIAIDAYFGVARKNNRAVINMGDFKIVVKRKVIIIK